jgi:hypothetical protein
MNDYKFILPIVIFGVILITSFLILCNHKKIECEKSGGLFYSVVVGKTYYYRCYKE